MPFHTKHRPKLFKHIIGNKKTISSLKQLLKDEENTPHVFLFQGPAGCGKTTIARILAKKLKCNINIDLFEINSSNNRGIDTAREIINQAIRKPLGGLTKVYILDECHQFTKDFMNAMLKLLEDTPKHCYFVLCTTNPEKLITALKSRCVPYNIDSLNNNQIEKLIENICEKENIKIKNIPIEAIVELANGSPRKALVLLQQCKDNSIKSKEDLLKIAKEEDEITAQAIDLCKALINNKNWKIISKILKNLKGEPEQVRRAVLGYANSTLLNKGDNHTALIIDRFQDNFYDSGKAGLTLACHEVCSDD